MRNAKLVKVCPFAKSWKLLLAQRLRLTDLTSQSPPYAHPILHLYVNVTDIGFLQFVVFNLINLSSTDKSNHLLRLGFGFLQFVVFNLINLSSTAKSNYLLRLVFGRRISMDKEQEEIQFLGFFGIFKESFNVVQAWRKIFGQITLVMIIPLSFIYLAHIQISHFLFSKILLNEYILHRIPRGTRTYDHISDMLSSEWITFLTFKIGYFIFFLILTLLSTSAVVYTIACIYTAKDISFKKVMSVVPKVWKRLMVTFIWNFVIVFAYNIVAVLLFVILIVLIGPGTVAVVGLVLLLIIYLVGFAYISVIWHLASVISVLEESFGIKAMVKSQDLIKGKMGVSMVIFIILNLCFFGIQFAFEKLVVLGDGLVLRIGYGIFSVILLSLLILWGLIIQTIIYFICKSHHHENIDKSSLADHLEVYLGEYVPLTEKNVQLEQFYA